MGANFEVFAFKKYERSEFVIIFVLDLIKLI